MAKNVLPPEVTAMFAACERAYEQATLAGYGENPNVIAAVSELKFARNALHIARCNLMVAKGFFAVEFADVRFERACRATCEACSKLQAAIAQAAAEHHLHNRYVNLANPDQGVEKRAETVSDSNPLRLLA
jgi:hypothetical protein